MADRRRRCPVCGAAHAACGLPSDPSTRAVDVIDEKGPRMGDLKRYDVSGKDLGDGKPAPAGTLLKLDDQDAERLGLKKPARSSSDTTAESKPRTANTRKRPTPSKRR